MYRYLFVMSACFLATESLRVKRLVGGSVAKIQDFPYQLSLEINDKPNCSATIMSNEWAITTAFCLNSRDINPSTVKLRSGSTFKNKGGTIHQASKIIIHPSYNATRREFDFALIQVREPFKIGTPGVDSIYLAWNEYPDGTLATLSGWGVINNKTNQETNELYSVQVPILNRGVCKGVWAMSYWISEEMICAGYAEGGKDGCTGDLGSPLVVGNAQIGILSRTFCGDSNSPSIYSNIPMERQWIRSVTGM